MEDTPAGEHQPEERGGGGEGERGQEEEGGGRERKGKRERGRGGGERKRERGRGGEEGRGRGGKREKKHEHSARITVSLISACSGIRWGKLSEQKISGANNNGGPCKLTQPVVIIARAASIL